MTWSRAVVDLYPSLVLAGTCRCFGLPPGGYGRQMTSSTSRVRSAKRPRGEVRRSRSRRSCSRTRPGGRRTGATRRWTARTPRTPRTPPDPRCVRAPRRRRRSALAAVRGNLRPAPPAPRRPGCRRAAACARRGAPGRDSRVSEPVRGRHRATAPAVKPEVLLQHVGQLLRVRQPACRVVAGAAGIQALVRTPPRYPPRRGRTADRHRCQRSIRAWPRHDFADESVPTAHSQKWSSRSTLLTMASQLTM